MADGAGVPRLALGCAFVALGVIVVIAWLATFASFYTAPFDDLPSGEVVAMWQAVAIGTTWVAYWLSRKLWPSSESNGSEGHSWRKPGRWRLAYAVPWLAVAGLYFLSFGGVRTPQDYLDSIPWVLVPALFPAVGFLLIRPKFGLWVVALLGLPIAAWLLLLVSFGEHPGSLPLFIALLAALLASLIAVVVLWAKVD